MHSTNLPLQKAIFALHYSNGGIHSLKKTTYKYHLFWNANSIFQKLFSFITYKHTLCIYIFSPCSLSLISNNYTALFSMKIQDMSEDLIFENKGFADSGYVTGWRGMSLSWGALIMRFSDNARHLRQAFGKVGPLYALHMLFTM